MKMLTSCAVLMSPVMLMSLVMLMSSMMLMSSVTLMSLMMLMACAVLMARAGHNPSSLADEIELLKGQLTMLELPNETLRREEFLSPAVKALKRLGRREISSAREEDICSLDLVLNLCPEQVSLYAAWVEETYDRSDIDGLTNAWPV